MGLLAYILCVQNGRSSVANGIFGVADINFVFVFLSFPCFFNFSIFLSLSTFLEIKFSECSFTIISILLLLLLFISKISSSLLLLLLLLLLIMVFSSTFFFLYNFPIT